MAGEPDARDDGQPALMLRLADPCHALAGVRLLPGNPVRSAEFRRTGPDWQLTLARPPLDRLEYLLELRYPGGGSKVITDPANPREVPGAFGPKSVLEFGGYATPDWLTAPADPGDVTGLEIPAAALGAAVAVRVWAPSGTSRERRLPLLVVHDGPEYASLASLTQYLGAGVAAGWLPPLRAALLPPGQRTSWYSANVRYARALTGAVIPALTTALPSPAVIGMGTSLGALSLLHAHCRRPGIFSGLFLQSGSFFAPDLDSQERGVPHYRRITTFTATLADGGLPEPGVSVVMTCGALEENVANNRRTQRLLTAAGYPAWLHEGADLHNYTAWRDALDPHLTGLLVAAAR